MTRKEIIIKADAVREKALQYFIDHETGLVFSKISREKFRVLDDSIFSDARQIAPSLPSGCTMAEFYAFENASMATGAFMNSEILRYRRTGEPGALAQAKVFFHALWRIFCLGKASASGFFTKPYGRRLSPETSTDQVLYACSGMESFYPFATRSEQKQIREMLPEMVAFWIRRDYRYHYFNLHPDDWQWPIMRFPPLLLLAMQFSQDPVFRQEYERLVHHTAVSENECLDKKRFGIIPLSPLEHDLHGYIVNNSADRITMDTMQYDILLRFDPGNTLASVWKNNLRLLWKDCSLALLQDGKALTSHLVDFQTGRARRLPVDPTWEKLYLSGASTGWSTMIVRAGLQIAKHLPELAAATREAAENVVQKLAFEELSYYDEPERFLPSQRFKTRFLSGDSVGNFLWTAEFLAM